MIVRTQPIAVPLTDCYCTPGWLTGMLYPVDLDPCSNPRSTVRARRTFSLEKRLNGLALPWTGSVFLNWPYSAPLPWARKVINELALGRCTEAIILCKQDSSTEWWDIATGYDPVAEPGSPLSAPPDLWLFDKRIQFDEPPGLLEERLLKIAQAKAEGKKPPPLKSSNNFASVIIHHRRQGVDAPALNLHQVATCWRRAA
jgi:hypothetical protein